VAIDRLSVNPCHGLSSHRSICLSAALHHVCVYVVDIPRQPPTRTHPYQHHCAGPCHLCIQIICVRKRVRACVCNAGVWKLSVHIIEYQFHSSRACTLLCTFVACECVNVDVCNMNMCGFNSIANARF